MSDYDMFVDMRCERDRAIAERNEARDCGQDGVCVLSPGCQRHWQERNTELVRERDAYKAANQRDAQAYHDAAAEQASWRLLLEEAMALDDTSAAGCAEGCGSDFEDNKPHLAECFVTRVGLALRTGTASQATGTGDSKDS